MKKNKNKIGIKQYLAKHKLGIFLYILVYVIASVATIALTLLSAEAILSVSEEVKNYDKALILFGISLAAYLIRRLCWYLSGLIYQKVANQIMAELNADITNQAFKLSSRTYTDNNTGTFVQRMVSEPEEVVRNLSDMVEIITDILTAFVVVIYIATLNVWVGIILAVAAIISSFIEKRRISLKRKNRTIQREKMDKVTSIANEIVRSEKDIKSLGLENKLSEVAKADYGEYKKASYKLEVTDMNHWTLRQVLIEIASVAVLILGILMLDKGILTLATFMLIYSNHGQLYALVWSLGNVLDYINKIQILCGRMFALFNEKAFPAEKFGIVSKENVTGKIEFKKVSFSFVEYEERPDIKTMTKKQRKEYWTNPPEREIKSTNEVFKNLSFKIEPNTTVAFVGKSGSGKSTILNLMSKMYEVDSGKVLIDGININDFDKPTLRNTISLVNQFPYIFDMTIKENLLLAKSDATDEEIMEAIKKSSLEEFIVSLKDGINTKVGESGIKLSGGQKQRLAIARAMLRNSPIIIFDESTSSLDNFAQGDIKKSIDGLKGKSTIIIVAHRLSTIRNVDKIFFLDNGKIEDIGTFDELFENNVKFKNMFYAENLN